MSDDIEITFPTDLWYSQGDENSFFNWLYSISGYVSCQGILRTLFVKFDRDKVDENAMLELVSLFERYPGSDIKQLKILSKGRFGTWFSDPDRYWYDKVFS